jgi:hypothetical protein
MKKVPQKTRWNFWFIEGPKLMIFSVAMRKILAGWCFGFFNFPDYWFD